MLYIFLENKHLYMLKIIYFIKLKIFKELKYKSIFNQIYQ